MIGGCSSYRAWNAASQPTFFSRRRCELIESFRRFTTRAVVGMMAFLVLVPATYPASAHGYCIGHRHWVGMADYYGVPWAYSDFFDNPYVHRCRDASAHAGARGVAHANGYATHRSLRSSADSPPYRP